MRLWVKDGCGLKTWCVSVHFDHCTAYRSCNDHVFIVRWFIFFLLERIAVGSLSGILRIYNPHHDGEGFKPEQVLLEQNLGMPILQLACGKFVA